MKKKLNVLKIALLSTLLFTGVGFAVYQSVAPQKVEAAQFLDDYDAYTYTGNYYKDINFSSSQGEDGALRRALTSLIKPAGYYSYSGTGNTTISYALQYADEDPNNHNNMIYLYTRNSVAKNAASSWNREHVWCQSLSNNNWGKSQGGTDVLHLRPTYQNTNSSRGNTPYGEVDKSYAKYYQGMLYGYCENANDYFMPIDQVKGDVARTVMYLWVTYNNTSKPLRITDIFESYDTLLRWHSLDRPDVLEGNRNNWCETESKQGNRNPFVDHPELAWKIFGDKVSASVKSTCMQAYPENGGGDPVTPTGISLNQTTAELNIGNKLQLIATLLPNGATGSITWTSSNGSVATVSSTGLVTAVAAGSATITAKYSNSITATCTVTVADNGGGNDESEFEIANSISAGDTVYLGCSYATAQYNGPSASTQDAIGTYANYEEKPDYSVCPLEVHTGSANNTYAFEIKSGTYNGKYIAYEGSKNSLRVVDTIQNSSSWTVAFSSGNATIANYASSGRVIWWNHSSPRFCCYTGKSAGEGFKNVQLWKLTSAPVATFNLDDALSGIETVYSIHGTETYESTDHSQYSKTFSTCGYNDAQNVTDLTIGNVSVTFSKASGSNDPKYYNNGSNIRVYGNNTMTFSSAEMITRINFQISSGYPVTRLSADTGTVYSDRWEGMANTIVFSNDKGEGQFRFTAVEIQCGYETTTINSVSLRFGAEMPKTTWNAIAENCTINDYGVMLVKKNTLINTYLVSSIEEAFEEEYALAAVSMGSGATPFESGDNYVFKANINVSNYETEFCAAPFMVINGDYHFLTEKRYSAKQLAGEYLDNNRTCELSDLALKIIAGKAQV